MNKLYSLSLVKRLLYSLALHVIFLIIVIAGLPITDKKSDVENITVIDLIDVSEITNIPMKKYVEDQKEDKIESASVQKEIIENQAKETEVQELKPALEERQENQEILGPLPSLTQDTEAPVHDANKEEVSKEDVQQNPDSDHHNLDKSDIEEKIDKTELVVNSDPEPEDTENEKILKEKEKIIEKTPEFTEIDSQKELPELKKDDAKTQNNKDVFKSSVIKQNVEQKIPKPNIAKKEDKALKTKNISKKDQAVNKKPEIQKNSLENKFKELERLLEIDNNNDKFQKDLKLSLSEIDSIRNQIRNAWNPIAFSGSGKIMKVVLLLNLDKKGNVISVRPVLNNNGNASYSVFVESVVRAAYNASPIKNLLPEKFQSWKEMKINFTSEDMAKLQYGAAITRVP